jgi:hypothetical protein
MICSENLNKSDESQNRLNTDYGYKNGPNTEYLPSGKTKAEKKMGF